MMDPVTRFIARVAATPAGIQLVAGELDGFWAEHGLRDAAAWPLQVALDEILSNIVRHAGPVPEAGNIEIAVELRDDTVEMTISDEGPAFDPLQLPEPDVSAPLEERSPGGLGVHLVRQLMDRVEYSRAGERNQLIMTWRPRREAARDS